LCFIIYTTFIGLCQTISYYNNLKELGPTQTATGISIDYWVVGRENDEVGGQDFGF
jgi:hypothetical protein